MDFIDIQLLNLLFDFMKISTNIIIIILITDMYWVFINHEYVPVVNIIYHNAFTMESDNSCIG